MNLDTTLTNEKWLTVFTESGTPKPQFYYIWGWHLFWILLFSPQQSTEFFTDLEEAGWWTSLGLASAVAWQLTTQSGQAACLQRLDMAACCFEFISPLTMVMMFNKWVGMLQRIHFFITCEATSFLVLQFLSSSRSRGGRPHGFTKLF